MQNGLAQMSVEFWINVPVGGRIGNGTAITLPGFKVVANSNWARTPSGIVSMSFSTAKAGEPLARLGDTLGVIADGQWHQYVATFNGQNAYFYIDGELNSQDWVTNVADKVGPANFSGSIATTPSAITYTVTGSAKFDEIRVSNIALTPAQVKRNFENCHTYSATWYVSPTGLSTNTGTRSSPLDLTTGLTRVAADNKIVLLAGTYSGAQFQLTRSGTGALHNALITGDEGSAQAIIQTTGAGKGPTVSAGTKYVTLRNLTFSSDQQPGLTFSGSGYGNVIDGCRLTSNVDALSVVNSSGSHDPVSWDAAHYVIVPQVMLENSVLAAGTSSAGVRYTNSSVIVARHNTFTGGQVGAWFTGGSINVTLLNNIFTGQTGSGVYFNSDSLMDVDGAYSLVSYFGDGNVYNPAGGGYVATVVDGTTNNYSTVSDYAKYWYIKQYGAAIIKTNGDSGRGIGTRSEQFSIRGTPLFVASGSGDYRLAPQAPNLVDTGAAYVFGRTRISPSAIVWDGQGKSRSLGNAVDAGAYETAAAVSQKFTLATAAKTSAGVFDGAGKLIRTLWSGRKSPAGTVTAYWNGLNDSNVAVSNGNYTIKLLGNNVQYSWDGAMNNSSPINGPAIQANFLPIQSMVVIGSTAYYTPGYNEGRYMLNAFDLSNPYATTARGVLNDNTTIDVLQSIATDGTTLFAVSEHTTNHQVLLRAYAPADLNTKLRELTITASGAAAGGSSGIAVQPAGKQNLVFVAQKNDNKVYLYNKNTFAAYSTSSLDGSALGWNSLRALAMTSDGDLWVACKNTASGQWQVLRYTNFGGTPTLAATVSGGLANPVGIAVSIDGNKTLLVADSEDTSGNVHQQIKAYASTGGPVLWTLGQLGGYATNGPTITNDKFILQGMICPLTDGSIWITDLSTPNRTMHFSAARTFISDIQFARSYNGSVDQNNPTRVSQNFVEYRIDYSKPFTQNQGWTPVKNWSYLGTKNLHPASNYGGYAGLAAFSTLSNGRTYALVNAQTISGSSSDTGKMSLVELTANGLRVTTYKTPLNSGYWLDKNGSLIYSAIVGGTVINYNRLAMTGFDGLGNPQYAASATVIATAPWSRTWDVNNPYPDGHPYYGPLYLQMDSGLIVSYNTQQHSGGMHLGAVNPSTNQWKWQAMPGSGPFNGNGNYDTANEYGGNRVMVSGTNIVTGYNGEFWGANSGMGQANQFTHYNDDGLFIGQFGMGQLNSGGTWPNAYGAGGNSFSPFLVGNNGRLYLYANDEGNRSLNRWQATGLDTIQTTSLPVILGAPVAPSNLSATVASSSQINLSWTDNSSNETGFKIDRATNDTFTAGLTTVTIAANLTTYTSTGLAGNTTYYYRVRASNAAGDSAISNTASAKTLSNAPTNLALSNTGVAENQAIGTAVGTFATTDPDAGDSFTYALVTGAGDADNSSFTIVGSQLRTVAVFDYENKKTYAIRVQTTDQGGLTFTNTFTVSVTNLHDAVVSGRRLFYNQSYFDGNDGAAGASDDNAIASNKLALLPGQTATFANYSSYSKGINGIMVDVKGLPGAVTASDFVFKVSDDGASPTWSAAPAPSSLTLRTLANGDSRISIIWANNVIQKQWLQVSLKANGNTDLPADEVFYFGNSIGETGNSASNTFVDGSDFAGARDNPHNFLDRALIGDAYDINRDSFVDGSDLAAVRDNSTNFLSALKLITAPVAGPVSLFAASLVMPQIEPATLTTQENIPSSQLLTPVIYSGKTKVLVERALPQQALRHRHTEGVVQTSAAVIRKLLLIRRSGHA